MEQSKTNQFLETEKIGTLMRKYSVPCIISLLVAALYNIVDQIFIANADYLGSYGNAANTVVFPLTVLALSIAVMIGDGCCAFVSLCLGQKRDDDAHKSVGNSVLLCIVCSIVVTAIYLIFSDQIIALFGGTVNNETYTLAKEYFFYITLGIPFYMFGQCLNPIIRSDGSPKFAMASTVAGAITNLILDPIFIYVFKWGMMGAAVATVIGQVLTAVLAVWYLFHMKAVTLTKESFGFWPRLMKRFLTLGITSFLSQVSLVISMAAVNSMCSKYAALDEIYGQAELTQIPLAVIGIVMKFYQVMISICIGISAGMIPVVGYNIGAGRKDRAKQMFTSVLTAQLILGLVSLFIVEVLPYQLIAIFGAANETEYYTQFAVRAFRIYLCMVPLSMINKGTFIFLQAMGKAFLSTMLSLAREIVFGVALPLILPIFFGLNGILYSFPTADILTFIIAVCIIVSVYKELNADIAKQPQATA
ncbi:MAG: MATE family efflux transporter [Lachnospiraceae bacterium]|nr:MATE family efflux transporter [Lachnospiraceae bacterium]